MFSLLLTKTCRQAARDVKYTMIWMTRHNRGRKGAKKQPIRDTVCQLTSFRTWSVRSKVYTLDCHFEIKWNSKWKIHAWNRFALIMEIFRDRGFIIIANRIVPKWPMSQPIIRRNISWPMVEHQQVNSGLVQSHTISNVEFIFTLKLLFIFYH